MGALKTELIEKVKGFAPFEQIAMIYHDRAKFYQELNNYMIGGLVISSARMFLMGKPVDSSVDPSGQWWAENPDTWYVRWAAGPNGGKSFMDAVDPLPYVMFRRINPGGETKLRMYEWDKFYRKLK
tara:strand:- start:254 stop:631 length:378 start_codon:yes stop_codon:yes gene_type:complete